MVESHHLLQPAVLLRLVPAALAVPDQEELRPARRGEAGRETRRERRARQSTQETAQQMRRCGGRRPRRAFMHLCSAPFHLRRRRVNVPAPCAVPAPARAVCRNSEISRADAPQEKGARCPRFLARIASRAPCRRMSSCRLSLSVTGASLSGSSSRAMCPEQTSLLKSVLYTSTSRRSPGLGSAARSRGLRRRVGRRSALQAGANPSCRGTDGEPAPVPDRLVRVRPRQCGDPPTSKQARIVGNGEGDE